MAQPFSPETRPCPECGGQRQVYQNIAPEIVAFSGEAAKNWGVTRKSIDYTMVRCTNCGYTAFFFKEAPKRQ